MEKGAASRKEDLRGRDSNGGTSRRPEGPQEGPRSQLTEKGPLSGAKGTVSGTMSPISRTMDPISGATGTVSGAVGPISGATGTMSGTMGPISRVMGTMSGAMGPEVAPGPPSGAPSPHADSWLQRMLVVVLKAFGLRVSLPEGPPLRVLLLQRYMAEGPPTLPDDPCPAYYYDVTVTDGTYQEKCFLAPQLNGLLQRNGLSAGQHIKITHFSYMYNEKSLGPGFICIEELEILEGASAFAGPACQLGICHAKTTLPLKGSRKHYLPLWNNDDPFGEMWVARKPLREVSLEGKWRRAGPRERLLGGGGKGRDATGSVGVPLTLEVILEAWIVLEMTLEARDVLECALTVLRLKK